MAEINPIMAMEMADVNTLDMLQSQQMGLGKSSEYWADETSDLFTEYEGPNGILTEDLANINEISSESDPSKTEFTDATEKFTNDNTVFQSTNAAIQSMLSPQTTLLSNGLASFQSSIQQVYQAIQTILSSLGSALMQGL